METEHAMSSKGDVMSELLDSLDPIFADCVDTRGTRYGVDQPWVQDGFVYATDGKIIVRQKTRRANSRFKAPDGLMLFRSVELSSESVALPDIGPEQPKTLCPCCGGGFDGTDCIERKAEPVELGPGLAIADRYVWLLRRHGITEIQTDDGYSKGKRFCFRKGRIEGLVIGKELPSSTAT